VSKQEAHGETVRRPQRPLSQREVVGTLP